MSKLSEFQIIAQYFERNPVKRSDVICGIGDDAAIVAAPPANQQIAVAIDTLVEDVHFSKSTSAYNVGYKSLAVNLSDLAAMGAEPAWATLALTLPEANSEWLEQFAKGFFDLAAQYQVALIGGDTTRGFLTVSVQVAGYVPPNKILYRSGAKPGDYIYVTGPLGDAALAFTLGDKINLSNDPDAIYLRRRLYQPQPRIAQGLRLREFAHSAIDISDGLLADLTHILEASQVGATIYLKKIPLSTAFKKYQENLDWLKLALAFGDDYELCFTVAAADRSRVAEELPHAICIGEVTTQRTLQVVDDQGHSIDLPQQGYEHFIT